MTDKRGNKHDTTENRSRWENTSSLVLNSIPKRRFSFAFYNPYTNEIQKSYEISEPSPFLENLLSMKENYCYMKRKRVQGDDVFSSKRRYDEHNPKIPKYDSAISLDNSSLVAANFTNESTFGSFSDVSTSTRVSQGSESVDLGFVSFNSSPNFNGKESCDFSSGKGKSDESLRRQNSFQTPRRLGFSKKSKSCVSMPRCVPRSLFRLYSHPNLQGIYGGKKIGYYSPSLGEKDGGINSPEKHKDLRCYFLKKSIALRHKLFPSPAMREYRDFKFDRLFLNRRKEPETDGDQKPVISVFSFYLFFFICLFIVVGIFIRETSKGQSLLEKLS